MIRMSLQRKLGWQILESAKSGRRKAASVSSVRKSRYTSDFAYLVPYPYRSSFSEIVRANRLHSCANQACSDL